MPRNIRKYLSWIPAIAIAAAIFTFSAQNGEESSASSNFVLRMILDFAESLGIFRPADAGKMSWMLGTLIRKCAHMTEFSALYIALLYALYHWDLRGSKWLKSALFLTIAYAASDEFHQRFIPGRTGCITDVLIDSIGAILITALLHFIIKKRHIFAECN
jgi:VanZ family protein